MQRLNITLFPTNGRKSFYNKCEVLKDEKGIFYLRSYDTIVASYNPNSGIFPAFGRVILKLQLTT